jgi:branched-chain amino acid transport system permease protein
METVLNVLVVGILLGGIYGLVSIGLNLIFGVIRIVNFAQGELVMLGMYGAYLAYTMLGLDPYVSVLVVVPALFVIGLVMQRLVIQPLQNEPSMQIFATLATACRRRWSEWAWSSAKSGFRRRAWSSFSRSPRSRCCCTCS